MRPRKGEGRRPGFVCASWKEGGGRQSATEEDGMKQRWMRLEAFSRSARAAVLGSQLGSIDAPEGCGGQEGD